MATKLPHVTITEIPNTSPGATPGLWNTRYYEINENFDALSSYSPVGDCSTAAGTAAKAVTITNFELSKNAFVFVKFSAANTAANPTLNVTGTGAKAIYYQGAAVPASYLEANRYYHFVYDGSHWVLTGDVDVRFRYLPLTGGTLTGDLTVNTNLTVKRTTSLQAVTANKALTAKAGITSNTLTVTGATTLEGALAAQGGISTTTITATGTTTLAGLNASNIKASGTLTVNGSTTLKALGATNITASGTLAVSGATTLTGKLTANGGLTTKALTATSLDLNGNADISGTTLMTGKLTANGGIDTKAVSATTLTTSGNATVGGLLAVTGDIKGRGFVDAENSSGKGFRLIDSRLDLVDGQSYQIQDWPVRVVDKDGRTAAMVKYYNNSDGSSAIVLADVSYSSEDDQSGNWAQVTIGHKAGGTPFLETALPTSLKGGLAVSGGDLTVAGAVTFTNGLTVSGARAIFNHDIDANGALSVTKTLTAKGALAVTGAAAFSGTVTASKAIRSTDSLSAPMLYLGGTGAHIVRQLTNITKGTAPSSTVYVGNFLYPSGATNAVSNRIAGNEIAIGTGGNTTYTFTCCEYAEGSTKAASLRLGYAGEPYINLSADNINVGGMLNASEGITSAKGIAVQTGNISCASGTFVGNSTVNFAHNDTIIVNGQAPSGEQQRWPLAVYDKNNDALAYCKFTMRTTGTKEWAFCIAHPKSDDSGNALGGLIVTCDANGKYGTTGVTADASSNSTDLATTFWVRRYIWDADESKLVHTVNNETISGTKTFNSSIYVAANPLIQSTPWSNIGIADSSRSATSNKMIAGINDKDGKRYVALEVSAGDDGSRQFSFNGRRRDDTGWVVFLRCIEYADGSQNLTAGQHPPAGDNSLRLATTGWVVSHQKTSDTNAEKQVHFEAQDTRVGHKAIEPQFCEESLIPRA